MAPVSIQEVINSILQILIKSAKGTFHLSSKNACSYYEFYKKVTGQAFIKDKKNLKNYWKENPILAMKKTSKVLGIQQKTWEQLFLCR